MRSCAREGGNDRCCSYGRSIVLAFVIPTGIVGVITLYLTVLVSNGLTVADSPWRFDMFSHLSCRDELVRVDNYSSQLAKLKDVLAVVVIYAGRDA